MLAPSTMTAQRKDCYVWTTNKDMEQVVQPIGPSIITTDGQISLQVDR